MMASPLAAAGAAVVALVFCMLAGLPIALRLFPNRGLAIGFAPTIGWAAFSALALPILCVVGFGPVQAAALAGATLATSAFSLSRVSLRPKSAEDAGIPRLALFVAALLAIVPASALLPKEAADGVMLAAPIFDHSKVAMIDEIVRSGVPAQNPFYGGGGSALAYYYLWHFSAAMLTLVPGVSGWEADVGLTAFTAFATISLAMALAVAVAGRSAAAYWALALTATASARPLLTGLFGRDVFGTWLSDYPDLGGVLVQATWAPQHVAAAGCVVVALLLLRDLQGADGRLAPVILGLLAAAGFGASVWVGGVTFVLSAAAVGAVALTKAERCGRLVVRVLLAAAVALAASSPILIELARTTALRAEGAPVAVHPYEVFGPAIWDAARRPLDLIGFWLVQLPLDIPAIYPAGLLALIGALRVRSASRDARRLAVTCALAAAASFGVSWLLVSTILNNDLGWRAILPGVIVLTAFAAAGLSRWTARPFNVIATLAAVACLLTGVHGAANVLSQNAAGRPSASAAAFGRSPDLWRAVRRQAGPTERIANSPDLFADVTPWPVNISWALLSDRRSCYAGWELARPFAPVPRAVVERDDKAFRAAFDGTAPAETVRRLFESHECRLVVVTATDGAWTSGAFAQDAGFELLDESPGAWRIYRFTARPNKSKP